MAAARAKAEPEERPLEELSRLFDEGGPQAISAEELARLEAHWAALPADPAPPVEPQPPTYRPLTEQDYADAAATVFGQQGGNPAHSFQAGSAMLSPGAELERAQRDDSPLSVWEAIAEVTRRIGVIAKDKQTTGGERYNFRGIDDALAALHPLLGDVGLLLLPGEVAEQQRETRQTAKGGTLNVCHLRVRYLLVGPDGSQLWGEAWGEAGDSGDKATQKAHSQSYKTFVFQTFSIPTQQSAADEPDASSEPARSFTADETQRASNAWQAARQAATIAALSDVRNRALALLQVPVPMPEEGVGVPLGLLLDRRRDVLERTSQQGGN